MFENMSVESRRVISGLIARESVLLGGEALKPFSSNEAALLYALASRLPSLASAKGKQLVDRVLQFFDQTEIPETVGQIVAQPPQGIVPKQWRIGKIEACSFRGLAPAEVVWEHDFAGKSLLLHGPNGCGKSSLLGAISWCLTGSIFRDDCAPACPQEIDSYDGTSPKKVGHRPDALSLTKECGTNTCSTDEYWVKIQFISKEPDGAINHLWICRNSNDGLRKSDEGTNWVSIQDISEAGIPGFDTELHVLMPARVQHIRFGKNQDLIGLFSAIIGLDDLEHIVELASRSAKDPKSEATKVEKDIGGQENAKLEAIKSIQENATDTVRCMRSFADAMQAVSPEDVEAFQGELEERIKELTERLAEDLGIQVRESDSEGSISKVLSEDLKNLPGHVHISLKKLEDSVSSLFPNSVGLHVPDEGALEKLSDRLGNFEDNAKAQIRERLDWALKEESDNTLNLMLLAAEHFSKDSKKCPVCSQDLKGVPDVKQKLCELSSLSIKTHLKQRVDDLHSSLISELNNLVDLAAQLEGTKTLVQRIQKDWGVLNQNLFPGLLSRVGERYEKEVIRLSGALQSRQKARACCLVEQEYRDKFASSFEKLEKAINNAWSYLKLAHHVLEERENLKKSLSALLSSDSDEDSLRNLLQRGRSSMEEIEALKRIQDKTAKLVAACKSIEKLKNETTKYRDIASAANTIKSLGNPLRKEVVDTIEGVQEAMKANYRQLYTEDMLVLDTLTPGHAANSSVKDEINAYFLAGNERVPIGPYSNAGRLRAVIWSLVFALLEQSSESLGFLILDDPVQSFDDEHKSRFVNNLIGRFLTQHQIVVATHYQNFYKTAEPTFKAFGNCECLEMVPRRKDSDCAAFEPSDLLERVDNALQAGNASWQEAGINLRKWGERALNTLSSYCPEPFFNPKNFLDSIDAYARIIDGGVATSNRQKIVEALKSPKFEVVRNKSAHDSGELTKPEVKDALSVLKECRKHYLSEISHFKQRYRHSVAGNAIVPSPSPLRIEAKAVIEEIEFQIAGQAAAASEGRGIEFVEFSKRKLAGVGVAVIKYNTLEPIARKGDFVLLGPTEDGISNGDLVIARTESGENYARRYWDLDGVINLEVPNITRPDAPVILKPGGHGVRRIIGVIFDGLPRITGDIGKEWFFPNDFDESKLSGRKGVLVQGTSMEPIARKDQIAILHNSTSIQDIKSGSLACIDIEDHGSVIKRCFPNSSHWILLPVNPNDVEDPMSVSLEKIRHAYPLAGVLFETHGYIEDEPS
jgi:recombinational DNA repair ATPase RecF